jgi:hypothetical protein
LEFERRDPLEQLVTGRCLSVCGARRDSDDTHHDENRLNRAAESSQARPVLEHRDVR